MNDEINYKNNPLNSVGLKKMLIELTDHYGFDILFAYLNINCFRNNPSVTSSVKFLKKTVWAREKVEGFYLYSFKSLPKASYQQSQVPPRDRIIPDDQTAGKPALLTLEDAERLRDQRKAKAAEFDANSGSGDARHRDTEQNNRRPIGRGNDSTLKDSRKSSASSKRTASTRDNPWGLPRT